MVATFIKTFNRPNIDISWPPQIREIDDYITSTYLKNLSWRVTSVSDDELTLSYASSWSSIVELEAALEDDIILNNISKMNTHCKDNDITTSYTIN